MERTVPNVNMMDLLFTNLHADCIDEIVRQFKAEDTVLQLRVSSVEKCVSLVEEAHPRALITGLPTNDEMHSIVARCVHKYALPVVFVLKEKQMEHAVALRQRYPSTMVLSSSDLATIPSIIDPQAHYPDKLQPKSVHTEPAEESETTFRLLADALDTIIILADLINANHPIIFANRFTQQVTGYTLGELEQTNYWDLVTAHDATHDQLHKLLINPNGDWFSVRDLVTLQTKSGQERQIRVSTSVVPFGGRMCLLCAGVDLTDEFRTLEKVAYQAQILQNVTDAIISADRNGQITSWNRGAEDIYGWSADEAIGMTLNQLTDTRYAVGTSQHDALDIVQDKGSWRGEVEQLTKDGSYVAVDSQVRVVRDTSGGIVGYVGINRDIGDRKRRERELKESERRFRLIADALPSIIWITDEDMQTIFVNASWLRTTGATFEDALDNGWQKHIHPEDLPRIRELRADASSRRVEFTATYRLRRPNDDYRWVESRGVPFYNEFGRFTGYIGVINDITEQRRAEDLHLESEMRFKRLADNAPIMIWTSDYEGKLDFVNKRWLAFTGASPGDDLQAVWENTLHPESLAEIRKTTSLIGEYLQLVETEHRRLNADGEYRWVLNKSVPRFLPSGEFEGFIGAAVDTTVRRRAEQALLRNQQYLEAQVDARTRVIQQKNEQLSEELEQRKLAEKREREMRTFTEALVESMALVNSTLELQQVFDLILESLHRVVDHDAADIMMLESNTVRVARVHGYKDPEHKDAIENFTYSIHDLPTLSTVYKRQQALVIRDTLIHPLWSLVDHQDWIRSMICAPIIGANREMIGFINVCAAEPNFFTEEHAQRLQAFSNEIAVAIRNAQAFEEAAALARLEERQELARDLHDSVSQYLFTASLMAEMLPALRERNPDLVPQRLKELHGLTRSALAEMRNLLLELKPDKFVETSPHDLIERLIEGVKGRAAGLDIAFVMDGDMPLPFKVKQTMYRILQEAMNNTIKHAGATTCSVSYVVDQGGLTVTIEDNGDGFDMNLSPRVDSMGLGIMKERAKQVGGHLETYSALGQGTKVVFTWKDGNNG